MLSEKMLLFRKFIKVSLDSKKGNYCQRGSLLSSSGSHKDLNMIYTLNGLNLGSSMTQVGKKVDRTSR